MDKQRKKYQIKKKKKQINYLPALIALVLILCVSISVVVFAVSHSKKNKSDIASSDNASGNIEMTTVPETTTSEPEVEINVCMIGDMLIHEGVYKTGLESDGSYNFDHLFANILTDLAASDMNIVNQETILGGTEMGLGGYPAFNSPQEIGDAEVKAGFNIILHATNHTLDRGLSGVNNTIEFWKTKHPDTTYLGIHDSEEDAKNIYVYEKQGFKVAVLNYTYGTNGIAIPSSAPYCVDTFDDEAKVRDDIRRAHKLADMVIVCPHWGTEYVYESTSYQDQWTNVFLEEGVDVVLGTHPHVIEPVKEFTRESDGHKMVVYYSLGNFVSNQDEIPRMIGGMAKLTLYKKGDNASIKSYEFEPVVTHKRYGYKEITTYKLSDYTPELASQNKILSDPTCCYTGYFGCICGATLFDYPTHGPRNFSVDYCKQFCKAVLGDIYKDE